MNVVGLTPVAAARVIGGNVTVVRYDGAKDYKELKGADVLRVVRVRKTRDGTELLVCRFK